MGWFDSPEGTKKIFQERDFLLYLICSLKYVKKYKRGGGVVEIPLEESLYRGNTK